MLVRADYSPDGDVFSGMGVYEGVGADAVTTRDRPLSPQIIKAVSSNIIEEAAKDEARQIEEQPIIWAAIAASVLFGGMAIALLIPPKKPVPAKEKAE